MTNMTWRYRSTDPDCDAEPSLTVPQGNDDWPREIALPCDECAPCSSGDQVRWHAFVVAEDGVES